MRKRLWWLLLGGWMSTQAWGVELNGELVWVRSAVLSVPVSGRVDQVAAVAGDAVAAGAVLVTLDARLARAHLSQARAALKDAEQQRAEARREWDRAKELYDRTVLSERELQLAEIGFATADAHYQSARAALVAAEVDMDYGALKAPFDAWVLAVHVVPGQAVVNSQPVTPLVTLAERGRMLARAAVSAAQAQAWLDAPAARVRVGDRQFDGRVVAIGREPIADDRPARYALDVEFLAPDDRTLRAGQAAVLVLP